MSHNRQLHFDKHIRNQPTAGKYVDALLNSPYRTHRRMGRLLADKLKAMVKEEQDKLVNEIAEEKDLEDTIAIQTGGDPDHS